MNPKGNGAVAMEMQERKEPEFVKFAEGEVVEGVLLFVDRIAVGDPSKPNGPKKPAVRFTVEVEGDKRVSFLGTYDLVTKLNVSDRGHYVIIRYEGEDKTVARNGNAMKRYNVQVSKNPVRTGAALPDTTITDEDIPF